MISIPSDYSGILETPDYKVKYKVEVNPRVQNGWLGQWIDLTNLFDTDWVEEISINADIDSPVMDAAIKLKSGSTYLSLNPLNTLSAINNTYSGAIVRPYSKIRVLTKLVQNFEPQNWINIFEGYIDKVNIEANDSLSLDCRDLGGRLQDTWIEEEKEYGSNDGSPVYTEMQKILNDNASNIGYSVTLKELMSETNDIWKVKKWKQDRVSIMDALISLADQIGWSIRYKWDSNSNAWVLTFYCVERDNPSVDFTFQAYHIKDFRSLDIDIASIRNVVKVVYYTNPNGKPQHYTAIDTTSQALYGRRFMEIAEANTSHINSSQEAQTLAESCLKDLKDPKATCDIDVNFFPFVELGDYYRFSPCRLFSDNLELAVVGYSHEISKDSVSTSLSLRGKPSSGYFRWYNYSTQQNEPANLTYDFVPSILGTLQLGSTLKVYLSPIEDRDFSHYEIHLSNTSDFTPSESTLVSITANPRVDISLLPDPSTYGDGRHTRTTKSNTSLYLKAIAVDKYGNKSDPSEPYSLTSYGFLESKVYLPINNVPANGTTVDISNLGLTNPPKVFAIPVSIKTYSPSYSSSNQKIEVKAYDITNTDFKVICSLRAEDQTIINHNGTYYYGAGETYITLNSSLEQIKSITINGTGVARLLCGYWPAGPGPGYIFIGMIIKLYYSSNGTDWSLFGLSSLGFSWYDTVVGYYGENRTYSGSSYCSFYPNSSNNYYWRLGVIFDSEIVTNNGWSFVNGSGNTRIIITTIVRDRGVLISGGDVLCVIIPQD